MDYAQQQRSWGRHLPSILVVGVLHILLGWALVNGLARRVVEVIKQPIETKVIEEVKKPPPEIQIQQPPPPPQQTITSVTTTPPPPGPPPKVYTPPAPTPAPAQPPIRKEYKASYRVDPSFPREAIRRGISGHVVAWVHVAPAGNVTDVEIRSSSNRMFNQEVIRALSQWKFNPEPVGFIGEYQIDFNLKD